jgi:hypothetical protein
MRRLLLALGLFAGLAGAAACSSTSSEAPGAPGGDTIDGGTPGLGDPVNPGGDAGAQDSRAPDGAGEASAPAGDILGTLASGACGVVRTELTAPTPSLENNLLVFVAGETYDRAALSPGGQTLFDTANAGGSSTESEVLSYEILRYCEGATLLHTETQIAYQPPNDAGANTISDLEVSIDGKKVGVSVVRAYRPASQPFPDADVQALLTKKLEGIVRSSQRVLPQDRWVKQILHVFTANKAATDAVGRVWPAIAAGVRADTIVLVTQTTGGGFVYCDPNPPLGSECP